MTVASDSRDPGAQGRGFRRITDQETSIGEMTRRYLTGKDTLAALKEQVRAAELELTEAADELLTKLMVNEIDRQL